MKCLWITLLVLLAGCASYVPKPLDPDRQQSALEGRRLDAPEVRQFVERRLGQQIPLWPPKSWDITTLTLMAFYFHPDLDRAQTQLLVAEAAMVTAGARPNPIVGISSQYNTDAPMGVSPWTNGLSLDIPIETAGKRNYRIERAAHLAHAARLREAEVVWQVRSRVRASLLAAYPIEAIVRRQHDLQEETTRAIERRFDAGFASQPELTQAHLALSRAVLALREIQKQVAENLARLAAAIGVPAAALQGAEISYTAFELLPPVEALPSAEARRQALLGRPDVLASLAEYEASQSDLQLEIARQYPDLSLGPGYLWDAGQAKWSLGLSFAVPLFNRNEGPIAEAKARREEAAATFLTIQARAIAEVDLAQAAYGHAVKLFETADGLLREQQRRESAVAAAFQAGEADRLAWISARYETAAAELARIDALSLAQQSAGRLEDALRRPLRDQAFAISAARNIPSKPPQQGE